MDIEVIETGNGGDIKKLGNDLALVYSFENMPYLAMFGGNVEQSTPPVRDAAQQAFDWWGNSLFSSTPDVQLNSLTERTLISTALTSSGRLVIEEAIKADLEFMRPFAIVTVATEIIATDVLLIDIKIKRPEQLQERRFVYIWEQGRIRGAADYSPNTNEPIEYLEQLLETLLG